MILRFTFLLVSVLFASSIFADKILIIVDKNPITMNDLENRKKLLAALQQINKDIKSPSLKDLHRQTYNMLVQERIVENQVAMMGADLSDEELKSAIEADEKAKKFPSGHMQKSLGRELYGDYMRYVKGQILWNRIVQDTLSTIRVLPTEIDFLVTSSNSKDMDLQFFELKSKKYSALQSIKHKLGKLKEMKKITASSNLHIDESSSKLSSLDFDIQNIIKNLQIGDTSSILRDGDEYKMFFLADKKMTGLTKEEMMFVQQIIGNQKAELMIKQATNFMKKRSFVQKIG
jgi:hypothetical protein